MITKLLTVFSYTFVLAWAMGASASQAHAKDEEKIWLDPEINAEYEYVGVGDAFQTERLCEAVGRKPVRFKATHVNPYDGDDVEKAAVRLINSPLKKFLQTKHNHAPGFAFWLSRGLYRDNIVFSYEDEPSVAKVITVKYGVNMHTICVSRPR